MKNGNDKNWPRRDQELREHIWGGMSWAEAGIAMHLHLHCVKSRGRRIGLHNTAHANQRTLTARLAGLPPPAERAHKKKKRRDGYDVGNTSVNHKCPVTTLPTLPSLLLDLPEINYEVDEWESVGIGAQ